MGHRIEDCQRCFRYPEAGGPVRPQGLSTAEWWIQGAAPGRQEVKDQIPFNPKAPGGRLLLEYFEVLGIIREECYITNTCFCMGENDRLPTNLESQICFDAWKYKELDRQENLKYVVLLGNNAIRQIFGYHQPSVVFTNGTIKKQWHERKILLLFIHHPGYLLRNPGVKEETLVYLRNFKEVIEHEDRKV